MVNFGKECHGRKDPTSCGNNTDLEGGFIPPRSELPQELGRLDNGRAHISQGSLCRLSFPILITSVYNYPASPLCRHSPQADLLLFPLIHQGPNLSLAHIQCSRSDIGMGN